MIVPSILGHRSTMSPPKRQSIKPPRALLFVLAAMVMFFAVVWGAVALATAQGEGHTCQTADKKQSYNGRSIDAQSAKCR
jgi:hypothetical protein